MAYTKDLKSFGLRLMRVQVPSPVPCSYLGRNNIMSGYPSSQQKIPMMSKVRFLEMYEESGHCQMELAEKLGVSRQRIHQILNRHFPLAKRRSVGATRHNTQKRFMDAYHKYGSKGIKEIAKEIDISIGQAYSIGRKLRVKVGTGTPRGGPPIASIREFITVFMQEKGHGRRICERLNMHIVTAHRYARRAGLHFVGNKRPRAFFNYIEKN